MRQQPRKETQQPELDKALVRFEAAIREVQAAYANLMTIMVDIANTPCCGNCIHGTRRIALTGAEEIWCDKTHTAREPDGYCYEHNLRED